MNLKRLLIVPMLVTFSSFAQAGGFFWVCEGKHFSAEWAGKPIRPSSGSIDLKYLTANTYIPLELKSEKAEDGVKLFYLEGSLDSRTIQATITTDLPSVKLSVFVDSKPIDEDIVCAIN